MGMPSPPKRGRDAVLRGELQTVGHRIDLTENLEGTDVPRAELSTLESEPDVSR